MILCVVAATRTLGVYRQRISKWFTNYYFGNSLTVIQTVRPSYVTFHQYTTMFRQSSITGLHFAAGTVFFPFGSARRCSTSAAAVFRPTDWTTACYEPRPYSTSSERNPFLHQINSIEQCLKRCSFRQLSIQSYKQLISRSQAFHQTLSDVRF